MPFSSIEELRAARDQALAASDYLMLPDAPYPAGQRDAAVAYREELRALPQRAAELGLENTEMPDYSGLFRYPSNPGPEPVLTQEEAEDASEATTAS